MAECNSTEFVSILFFTKKVAGVIGILFFSKKVLVSAYYIERRKGFSLWVVGMGNKEE